MLIAAMVVNLATGSLLCAQDANESASAGPQFAPGVLTTIPPGLEPSDTVNVHDMVEIRSNKKLKRSPNLLSDSRTLYEMAKNTEFRQSIWCLEFSFKPLRMLAVDIPQASGKMQRKLIWYMVYRVRNTGAGLVPERQKDGTYATVEKSLGPQRFIPQFFLTSLDRAADGKPIHKSYLDRILPSAVEAIARRELQGSKLLNNVEISEHLLEPEEGRSVGGLWGVATWEDVDPEIDFLAIYVRGLTNAYRWEDAADFSAGAAPGTGRIFERKDLQLNFWRPGDAYAENETEIRFGEAPGKSEYYGTRPGIAYQWIFR